MIEKHFQQQQINNRIHVIPKITKKSEVQNYLNLEELFKAIRIII